MNSQRLRLDAQDLHRSPPCPLCIYYGFQFSGCMVFVSGSLILVPTFVSFLSVIVFFFSMFYLVIIYY